MKFYTALLNLYNFITSDILHFLIFLTLIKLAIYNKEVNMFLESIFKNFIYPNIEIKYILFVIITTKHKIQW